MSRTIVDEDITRLPKWAQHRIKQLKSDIKDLKQQIVELSGDTPSDIQWSKDYQTWHNIPRYANIRFHLATGGYIEIYKNSQGQTRLTADRSLVIKPGAANSIFIDREDW